MERTIKIRTGKERHSLLKLKPVFAGDNYGL
jgi:hypothetical protein